jgi:hypothetical protein
MGYWSINKVWLTHLQFQFNSILNSVYLFRMHQCFKEHRNVLKTRLAYVTRFIFKMINKVLQNLQFSWFWRIHVHQPSSAGKWNNFAIFKTSFYLWKPNSCLYLLFSTLWYLRKTSIKFDILTPRSSGVKNSPKYRDFSNNLSGDCGFSYWKLAICHFYCKFNLNYLNIAV